MSDFQFERQLPELLKWRRPPIWDPVPDWLFEHLGVELVRDLLVIDLEMEREMIGLHAKALDRKIEILQRGR